MTRLGLTALALVLCACAPKTGILYSVSGPSGKGAIAELELIVAHRSYCERWVTDETATGHRYDVRDRDLAKSPMELLVEPVHRTDLSQPVRAIVLARDTTGSVIGYASFDAHPFRFEKVDEYKASIVTADGSGVAADGCACFAGQPEIGTGTSVGCDPLIPPSFARLQDTAGCELPVGEALPVGVCDGQLYPGEAKGRTVPCFASTSGDCKIGTRTCVDDDGVAYADGCSVDGDAPTLPTSALCDAFSTCAATACADPIPCTEAATATHVHAVCALPISPTPMDGSLPPCDGGNWTLSLPASTSGSCVGAMLGGTQIGPYTIGFTVQGQMGAQLTSSMCPVKLEVETVAVDDPAKLSAQTFSFSVGDTIYDIDLEPKVGCSSGSKDLHCTGL